ncbi:MAG: flagellar biosynthetic protein FliO [Gammaproteobacteria bacterium]
MYKQIAINPVRVKSVTPIGGKSKLVLVEAYGSHLLIGSNDTSIQLIKEFSPAWLRQYQAEMDQERLNVEQTEFETAMGKTKDLPASSTPPASSE